MNKSALFSALFFCCEIFAQNSTPFEQWSYCPDTTVVRVKFTHKANGYSEILFTDDALQRRETSNFLNSDSTMEYKLPIAAPVTANLYLNNWYTLLLTPGDTLFIEHDGTKNGIKFSGKNARLQQEIFMYDNYVSKHDTLKYIMFSELNTQNESLAYARKYWRNEQRLLEGFLAEYPDISDEVRRFRRSNSAVTVFSYLEQGVFKLNNKIAERLSKDYLNFIDEILSEISMPPIINGFSNDLPTIHDHECIFKGLPVAATSDVTTILREQHRRGIISMSKKERKIIDDAELYSAFLRSVKMGYDSLELASHLKLNPKSIEKQARIAQKYNIQEWKEQNPWETHIDYSKCQDIQSFHDFLVARPLSGPTRSWIMAAWLIEYMDRLSSSLSDEAIKYAYECVGDSALQQVVAARNNHYRAIEQKQAQAASEPSHKGSDTLNRAAEVAGITDADSLLHALTAPHRGKVIYMDIWGSWCGPCKLCMQHTPALKSALKGEQVVYIYLANNSPHDAWFNVIEGFGIYGETTFHYNLPAEQQRALEKKLGITKFPTYLLFDKAGRLVNADAPSPMKPDSLLPVIKQLLAAPTE